MDLLIRAAELVDGTGSPARPADVVVEDGKIEASGSVDAGLAAEVIDASGLAARCRRVCRDARGR